LYILWIITTFIVGHSLTLTFAISGSAVARAWSQYVNASLNILGICIP